MTQANLQFLLDSPWPLGKLSAMGKCRQLLVLGLLLLTRSAPSTTFLVTCTEDTTNRNCLRGAIMAANRQGGVNFIFLQDANYRLSRAGSSEDRALTGDLDVTAGSLYIVALQPPATMDASALGDRIFQVMPQAQLTLIGLTLFGGQASGFDEWNWTYFLGAPGGAIRNSGTLRLDNCRVERNASGSGWPWFEGGPGGGIFNDGSLVMDSCAVLDNSADGTDLFGSNGSGGGLYNSGDCLLADCSICRNESGAGGLSQWTGMGLAGGNGGGIFNSGSLKILRSTIAENAAAPGGDGSLPGGYVPVTAPGGPGGTGGHGGGCYNIGRLEIELSTISGNASGTGGRGGDGGTGGLGGRGGNGAGICNAGNLTVASCTIAFNASGNGGDGGVGTPHGLLEIAESDRGGDGGGLFTADGAITQIGNSIISQNSCGRSGAGTAPPIYGFGPDLRGDVTSLGYNLVGNGIGCSGLTNRTKGDQVGSAAVPVNPRLEPLRDNGGPTMTHSLQAGSPAIDQGRSFSQTVDQRGYPRLHDYLSLTNAAGGDGSDIGAFESDLPSLVLRQESERSALSWDASCPGYALETTTNLDLSGWTVVTGAGILANGELHFDYRGHDAKRFFRLRRN